MVPMLPKRRIRKQVETFLTQIILQPFPASDASGLNTDDLTKDECYTDIPLTSMHACSKRETQQQGVLVYLLVSAVLEN